MGKVAITYKIMPNVESDINLLKEEIKKIGDENIRVHAIKEEEFAFGIKILFATFIMDDKNPVNIEEKLLNINGVQSIEAEDVGLL